MGVLRLVLFALLAVLTAAPMAGQKASVALLRVTPTEGLLADIAQQGPRQAAALNLLADSITSSLPGAVNDTGKFDVVAQQDLDVLLESIEQQEALTDPSDPRVARAFRTAGVEYAIVVRIEQYDDAENRRSSGDDTLIRREIQTAATVSVVDVESGVLQKTLAFRPDPKQQGRRMVGGSGDGSGIGNDMVIEYGDEAGRGIARVLLEYFFPMRVVRVRGEAMSINRGEAAGVRGFDPDRSFTIELLNRTPPDDELAELYETFLQEAAENPGLYGQAASESRNESLQAFVEGLFEEYGVDRASIGAAGGE